jgi:sugar phosphate isomerase/epimerase
MLSRRGFLAASISAAPLIRAAQDGKRLPVGLELYSVRNELKDDLTGTVRAVAKMGYDGVEFYAPYAEWTPAFAKDVRKLLDELGIRCFSTHNGPKSFTAEGLPHAIELNQILGSKFIVLASAGKIADVDGWKAVAETLNKGGEAMKPAGLRAGYHNHALEFKEMDGVRPIEILAANTGKDVMLQLDVGTCVEVGYDPVAWIDKNPGRIKSLHVKEWSPENGYKALFGEGVVPWKKVLEAAKTTGGAQYLLIEQEGSRFPPLETAAKCLAAYKKMAV